MPSTSKGYPQDIDDDSENLLAKISRASALEQAGQTTEARLLYQEVAAADPAGTIGASARRALEAMDTGAAGEANSVMLPTTPADASGVGENGKGYVAAPTGDAPGSLGLHRGRRRLEKLYNIPINGKQLWALILSELLSLGLVGISAFAIVRNFYSQLDRQAESELAVTQVAYENKLPVVETTIRALGGGYSAVYLHKPTGEFSLAPNQEQVGKEAPLGVPLPPPELLGKAVNANGKPVTGRITMQGNAYTIAARSLPAAAGQPTAIVVRATPEAGLNKVLSESLWLLLALAVVAVGLNILLFMALSKVIAQPIKRFLEDVRKFREGDKSARAEVFADDEVGQLACCFNQMADIINASDFIMAEQTSQRQSELDFQRQENERLQQGVIQLLLDIEGAKMGDLTVRATVDNGEMGSVADAFNATIQSLNQLVTQMQIATNQVHQSAFNSEASVRRLSQEATTQAEVVSVTLNSVAEMAQSIQSVADSAQEAAVIARKALLAAQEGWETMDETVRSIQNIRTSVVETSKKVKRLAESSQEIYKIVSIISGISEKTNLLAFNASIEAARAGKNGQGFRVVADEVRRLAERVTNSTKEIEQLVSTIQQETAEVLQTMDQSTKQVVTGTKLVGKTKQTLENLAVISQKIDQLLQSISVSTVSQTQASKMVNQTMEEVAAIAKNTSSESEAVSSALQALVAVAEELQGYMAKFRVDK